ncbi:bacterial transcriptional activator domain-containing protein [Mycolicibacterium sp. CR10]|uniref:bacterial transcriptional activator domain-containing protein n=1 Tax=Mycolicibacterium sp. CR10 TaxID=2562314 RepID=UPI0014856CA8|nr:bacterial transcriptional activator domain-containing protein [Mycolicibacterium sp. CR10]
MSTDAGMIEAVFVDTNDGNGLNDTQARKADQAVAAYRGDLLEGCYLTWCVLERERVRAMYLELLDRLLGQAEATGDINAGLRYGSLVLRQDRAHERTHRRVMRLYGACGDRTGGLRQFERCRAALAEELGVEPAASTLALYESLRLGVTDNHASPAVDAQGSGGKRGGADDFEPNALRELQRTLERAQALLARQLTATHSVMG